MIYAAAYPEKFEGDKGAKLMQVIFLPNIFYLKILKYILYMDLITCYLKKKITFYFCIVVKCK